MAEFLCKTRLQDWFPGVWRWQEPAQGKQKYQIKVIPNIFILDINYWLLIIHVIYAISLRPVFRPGRHLDPTSDWPGFISLGFRVSHISSRLSLHKLSSHTRLQTSILFTRYRTSSIAYSITCNENESGPIFTHSHPMGYRHPSSLALCCQNPRSHQQCKCLTWTSQLDTHLKLLGLTRSLPSDIR